MAEIVQAGADTSQVRLRLLAIAAVLGLSACGGSDDGGGNPPPATAELVAEVPVAPNYGIHDTFVRDGIAFVSAWNTGVIIYDVGNGIRSGSPSNPVEVSRVVPPDNGLRCICAHNTWWFHNPVTNEKRYLFVGQEGAGTVGSRSSGDITVIDVFDLSQPQVVANFHMAGSGVHNFWMDETRNVLYAAYYNGGVVGIEVTGTLSGDLSTRWFQALKPGGDASTFVWGVQYVAAYNSVYAIDMESGLWQLDAPVGPVIQTKSGGFNVPSRWSSDLWVHGQYAYTGTWGSSPRNGNFGDAIFTWTLSSTGAPTLADSIKISGVGTISDLEVSADGRHLLVTTENGGSAGLYLYSLSNPTRPSLVGTYPVSTGLHTGTFGIIGGRTYVFAAKNPGSPALMVFDVTDLVE